MAKSMSENLWVSTASEGYCLRWFIPNWTEVRENDDDIMNQKVTVSIVGKEGVRPETKWEFGLRITGEGWRKKAQPYCLLQERDDGVEKAEDGTVPFDWTIIVQLMAEDTERYTSPYDRKTGIFDVNEAKIFHVYMEVGNLEDEVDDTYINAFGSVTFHLTINTSDTSFSPQYEESKMDYFNRKSYELLSQDMEKLFDENSTEIAEIMKNRLKIVANDGIEIFANAEILKARCPVFEKMLTYDWTEKISNEYVVKDVSGKTLKVILRYICSGCLSPSWCDNDTLIEFIYTAGKYQITPILDLLDDSLGTTGNILKNEVSELDTKLLMITSKLDLKKAEQRLLSRIVSRLKEISNGEELLDLFGLQKLDSNKSEKAASGDGPSTTTTTTITIHEDQADLVTVLKILDNVLQGNPDVVVGEHNQISFLLHHIRKDNLKTTEKILLKHFAEVAEKFTNAKELFAYFGYGF